MKILIAEDRNDDRYLLETLLDYAGYDYVSCPNGLAALKQLQQEHVDLIVSDILMDEMDGYELCQRVKNDARLAHIPFVFVTATYLTQADEKFALSLGADRFIKKPVDQTRLYRAITELAQTVDSDQYCPKKTLSMETFNRSHMQQVLASMEKKTLELEQMYAVQQKLKLKIQKSEKRYKAISSLASDYYYIAELSCDNRLEIKWIDGAFHRITGYESDSFKNLEDWLPLVFGHDADIFNTHINQIKTGRKTRAQYRIQPQKGDIRWVEDNARPMIDETDDKKGVVLGSVKDITRRKKEEEKLTLLATAVESASESILITDSSGDIEYVNTAFEHNSGYLKKEVIGQNPRLLKSEKNDPAIYKDLWETISNGRTWHGSFFNRRKDGSEYEVSGSITPILDSDKMIQNFIAVRQDITHERNLEKQVRQKQRLESIGTLAGGIAHDFNNILTAIIGFSEMNIEAPQEGESLKQDLIEIATAGHRAQQLVQQILTFARKTESQFEPIVLSDVIREAISLLKATLPATIDLKSDMDSTVKIMADPAQIHQIMMNLGTNASHALGDGPGTICVSLKPIEVDTSLMEQYTELSPGPHLVLTVEDTGCGMSKGVMEKIFDPFFTTKDNLRGTGLGLSTVYGIVRSHSGSISVYSEPGKGSTFKILFPVAGKNEPREEHLESACPQGKEHILFVDDEPAIAKVSTRILQSLGYTVSSSTSSIDALDMFKKAPDRFDLVITDMTMPTLNGTGLARELTAIRKNIPVIICSGYSDALMRSENLETIGVKAVLTKPVSTVDLSNTLRRILDSPQ